ncbi:hypothetical protein DRE_06405 [Drechslerella stenobrocha 248]|uniref:Uncharacterized protein n=1 Tax=Drechslerella stenobrocha 248 TaxID=1043628 RepID=W7HXC2_9PEZI|nr:hypothetical protein DRE_06405 [Drechslerella stenobrocha 248]
MLGIANFFGGMLIIVAVTFILTQLKAQVWNRLRGSKPAPAQTPGTEKDKPWLTQLLIWTWVIFSVSVMVWPLVACLALPSRSRAHVYPKRCGSGAWDFRVVLDGRYQPEKLTRGSVNVYDMRDGGARVAEFTTADFVNATRERTAERVRLERRSAVATAEGEDGGVYLAAVEFAFPYLQTAWEEGGWASLGDVGRETEGNYTAELVDAATNTTRVVTGEFPYLEDGRGLRLDGLGLAPDIARRWRALVGSGYGCQLGPDARLLGNADVTAREPVGGQVVLQTDMTKFGACGELTVCANRRGAGRELDELLMVPLGLPEQIRWGNCCGDGWEVKSDA